MNIENIVVVNCLQWQSPIGWLLAVAERNRLVALNFAGDDPFDEAGLQAKAAMVLDSRATVKRVRPGDFLESVKDALDRYLSSGEPLPELPINWYRGTPFQQSVWRELQRIPFAETRSYGEVAARIGRPRAARAVGGACAMNPIAIVVPCHRVVGSGGRLGGFGGGLETKRFLLRLERNSKAAHGGGNCGGGGHTPS